MRKRIAERTQMSTKSNPEIACTSDADIKDSEVSLQPQKNIAVEMEVAESKPPLIPSVSATITNSSPTKIIGNFPSTSMIRPTFFQSRPIQFRLHRPPNNGMLICLFFN